MFNKKLIKYLIYYYGIIQTIHLIGNGYAIFGPTREIYLSVSPYLSDQQMGVLFFSSLIDFIIASPTGILFAWGFVNKKKWANLFGIISLNFAAASALFYVYILWLFAAWSFSPLSIFIALAYVPIAMLQLFGLQQGMKNKPLI